MEKYEVRERYQKSLRDKVIDKDLVYFIIEDEAKKRGLEDYIKDVVFKSQRFMCLGSYNMGDEVLYLSPELLKIGFLEPEYKFHLLLETIYHELTHVKQRKFSRMYTSKYSNTYTLDGIKEEDKNLVSYVYFTLGTAQENYNKYKSVHDLLPIEHEANFNGVYKAIDFNRQYELQYLFNQNTQRSRIEVCKRLIRELLRGYSIKGGLVISPFEKVGKNQSEEVKKIILDNNFSDYQKLICGLPVDRSVLEKIVLLPTGSEPGKCLPTCTEFQDIKSRLLKR